MEKTNTITRILRRKEVLKLTGKSQSTLYRDICSGSFPRPKKLGANSVGWLETDIVAWINNLETA